MTSQEIEAKALHDYEAVLGKEICVTSLTGYKDDGSYDFDGPEWRVRVTATPPHDLMHWVDDWLDPYWNVELVGDYPELEGYRNFWTYGHSYRVQPQETAQ